MILLRRLICIVCLILALPGQAESLLEPGDRLQIDLPGEEAFSQPFSLDRERRINLPEVGVLSLAGMTLSQAESAIRTRLGKAFSSLDNLKIRLLERRLLVTVMGYVHKPGSYDLPPMATCNWLSMRPVAWYRVPSSTTCRFAAARR
ncbi:polysaccharide biosynthesis/export family protein [Aeromonas schubertii]|uniref:polysaccharide biosynthesis/export family protein n=1 Tax=Aeromonas schubertii TaxID=652 RepID=UPI001D04BCDF|nr:polysaccharide biosynthesis/export family protein [Aeromonas schubertii]